MGQRTFIFYVNCEIVIQVKESIAQNKSFAKYDVTLVPKVLPFDSIN